MNPTRWAIFCFVGVLVIGIYAWSANSGLIEFASLKAENTYYNLLVRGFRDGQLNLKTKVPPGLAQLADPYDPAASDPYRWNYGHPLHDSSFYKGKLYLYFGITPAVLLFWPYAALTGHYLLHKDAAVIFFSIGFLVGAGLLLAAWRRYFAEVSFWIIVPCLMALGLANFAPAILERSDVYEVAISCGYALTMLALAGIWCALHDVRRQWRWLAAASLAYGLALGARPSLLFGAIILLAPVVQAWREKRPVWPLLMAATVPIVLIGLGLMFYNAMRFDNMLEFGQRYQLASTRQDTLEQFSLRYLWYNFQVTFLEPARWRSHFPYVHDIVSPPLPKGADPAEHAFGVLTNIPLVWCALAVPLAWRNRPDDSRAILRLFLGTVSLLFVICALTVGLHYIMCLRYELEFAHALMWLAVIGILGLERALAGQPVWRRTARCGWGVLLIFSMAFNLLAGFDLRAEIHSNLGDVLQQIGKFDEASVHLQKALQINPTDPEVQNHMAWLLATCAKASLRNGPKAVELARQANAATGGKNPAMLHTLAAAYAEAGRFSEAVETAQRALQLAGEQSNNKLAGELQSELKLYQTGMPFHGPEQRH